MVVIVNCTSPPTETGLNKYKLCINQEELLEFEHTREEPLSVCLRKAADAFDVKYRGAVQFGSGHAKSFEDGVNFIIGQLFPK